MEGTHYPIMGTSLVVRSCTSQIWSSDHMFSYMFGWCDGESLSIDTTKTLQTMWPSLSTIVIFIGWMIGTTSVIFSFNWGIIHTPPPPPPPSCNSTIKVSTYSATEVSHHRHSLTELHGYPVMRINPRLCKVLWHHSSWILHTRHCANVSWRSSRPNYKVN